MPRLAALLITVLFWTGLAQAQEWNYVAQYPTGNQRTAYGKLILGGTDRIPTVRMTTPASQCFTGEMRANVSRGLGFLVVAPVGRTNDCEQIRFVIREDGRGGWGEVRSGDGPWEWDQFDRGLTHVTGALPRTADPTVLLSARMHREAGLPMTAAATPPAAAARPGTTNAVASAALSGQEWRYFMASAPTATSRNYLLRELRGSLSVDMVFTAGGGTVHCYRGTVDARAERIHSAFVLVLTPAFAGCEQIRLVLNDDGSGWEEQRMADGWTRTNYRLERTSDASALAKLTSAAVPAAAPLPVPQAERNEPTAPSAQPALRPTLVEAPKAAIPDSIDELRRTQQMLADMRQQISALQNARPAAPVAPHVAYQSSRALVIGNGRYTSFGRLANPTRDAQAIAQKLRAFGIPVDLVLDADRDGLIKSLNEYARRAAGADVNLLFYAGHGVQVEGINYMIPVNMAADGISAGYVKLAGISLNAALDYMPGKTRLVFLDACRDNPATRTLVGTRGGAAGLAAMNVASGTLIAYSTRDGATADDGDGVNSPYTSALLQHLDTPADISLVLRDVRQTVLRATGGRQEPWEYGSLVGGQLVLPLISLR